MVKRTTIFILKYDKLNSFPCCKNLFLIIYYSHLTFYELLEWFPGWQEHGNYNRQPNDDGLSEQDCVEIRRYYHRPSANGISISASSLTDSFMWNDRDCTTRNFFLCERPLIDGKKYVVIAFFSLSLFLNRLTKLKRVFSERTEYESTINKPM